MATDTSPLDPQRRPLHAILRAYLATFLLAHALPKFVKDELEGYGDCGVLAHGCAHFRCAQCGLSRVTALSCKGRGFCPRCIGRRMTQVARDLVSRVLPHVRIRQWTLSIPFSLRMRFAFDHELALAVWRIAPRRVSRSASHREIDRRYRRLARAAGIADPRGGSLLVIHRAGSDLKANLHYHAPFLDGAYDQEGQFFTAPAPTPAEVHQILTRIIARVARLLDHDEPRELDEDEAALARAYAASTRAERHAPDDDDDPHDFGVQLPTRRKARPFGYREARRIDQWDLDAEVAVDEHDRPRLEQLCRYLLRPPLALDRLRLLDDGRVCLELKRPWGDRTTHVTMTPDAFIGRLCSLVPRPKANTTVYFGVLAPNSKLRARIVPCPEKERRARPDSSWAALMKHSFGLDTMKCPRCEGRLNFVAVVHAREEVRRLLEHLHLWSFPLPFQPARGPPDDDDESFDFP